MLTGLLFFTGGINRIGFWLYKRVPGLSGVTIRLDLRRTVAQFG